MDELDARVRALEAERAQYAPDRPGRAARSVPELLADLIEAVHSLWKTPPDQPQEAA